MEYTLFQLPAIHIKGWRKSFNTLINMCQKGVCNQSQSRSCLVHMTKHGYVKKVHDKAWNSTQFTSNNMSHCELFLLLVQMFECGSFEKHSALSSYVAMAQLFFKKRIK